MVSISALGLASEPNCQEGSHHQSPSPIAHSKSGGQNLARKSRALSMFSVIRPSEKPTSRAAHIVKTASAALTVYASQTKFA